MKNNSWGQTPAMHTLPSKKAHQNFPVMLDCSYGQAYETIYDSIYGLLFVFVSEEDTHDFKKTASRQKIIQLEKKLKNRG